MLYSAGLKLKYERKQNYEIMNREKISKKQFSASCNRHCIVLYCMSFYASTWNTLSPVVGHTPPLAREPATTAMDSAVSSIEQYMKYDSKVLSRSVFSGKAFSSCNVQVYSSHTRTIIWRKFLESFSCACCCMTCMTLPSSCSRGRNYGQQ